MKIDLYTKVILTVIASCLLWDAVSRTTPQVSAQAPAPPPTPVIIVDAQGMPLIGPLGLRVNAGQQSLPVQVTNQNLTVNVTNQPVPVALTAIEKRGSWQPIPVDVTRQPPTLMPTP
jgi:hypothetical protein